MKKKISDYAIWMPVVFAFIMTAMIVIPQVSADGNIGTFGRGTVLIAETCQNATYSNITSVYYPQGAEYIIQQETIMNRSGTLFNYTLNYVNNTGEYIITGHCDENGADQPWVEHFTVQGIFSLPSFCVFLFIAIMILVLGLVTEDVLTGLVGCLALVMLGLYTFTNGIGIYENGLTEAFALIIVVIAIGFGAMGIEELFNTEF